MRTPETAIRIQPNLLKQIVNQAEVPDGSGWAQRVYEDPNKIWSRQIVDPQTLDYYILYGVPFIFSGGQSNFIGTSGELERNPRRDRINATLSNLGTDIADPQIWGRPYDPDIDGVVEKRAADNAIIVFTQIGNESFGAVSMLEVLRNSNQGNPPPAQVVLMDQDPKLVLQRSDKSELYLKEYIKTGKALRREFLAFIESCGLKCTDQNPQSFIQVKYVSDKTYKADQLEDNVFVIKPDKLHAADFVNAFSKALQGKKVTVVFTETTDMPAFGGTKETFNIDEYVQEANDMRQAFQAALAVIPNLPVVVDTEYDALVRIVHFWNHHTNTQSRKIEESSLFTAYNRTR